MQPDGETELPEPPDVPSSISEENLVKYSRIARAWAEAFRNGKRKPHEIDIEGLAVCKRCQEIKDRHYRGERCDPDLKDSFDLDKSASKYILFLYRLAGGQLPLVEIDMSNISLGATVATFAPLRLSTPSPALQQQINQVQQSFIQRINKRYADFIYGKLHR